MTVSTPTVAGPWIRLIRLHLESRRFLTALVAILGCAIALRIALHWPWTAYGALQLPLIAEAGCAVAITATTASPFGDPERVTGRRLRFLRLGVPVLLIAIAAAALAGAGLGSSLAGGNLEMLRNLVGLTGIGLLCAVAFGGALAWAGPTAYLIVGVYALYTLWHGPALTTPWIWPSRPAHDLGAAACAAVTMAMGLGLVTVRGAQDLGRE
jgi:hypothetical protein